MVPKEKYPLAGEKLIDVTFPIISCCDGKLLNVVPLARCTIFTALFVSEEHNARISLDGLNFRSLISVLMFDIVFTGVGYRLLKTSS